MSEGGNLVEKFKSKIAKTVGKKKKAPLTLSDLEPAFLRLQQHLEKIALDVEGVFRVSGSADRINELKKAITKNPTDEIDLTQYDVHDVAGCLKQLLRKLHEPLIPFSLYGYLIHTAHEMSDDTKKRLTIIKAVITSSMPETNKRVIKSLLFLLYAIQRKSKVNKMTSENLSVVIGPSILRKEGEDLESMMRDSGSVVLIVRDMIEYFPFFYEEKPVNIEEPVNLNEKEKELIKTGEENLDMNAVFDRVQKNYEESLKREKDLEARLNNEIKEKTVLETYIKMVEDQLGVEIATQIDFEKKFKAADAKLNEKAQENKKLSSNLEQTTKERDSVRNELSTAKADKEKLNTELAKEKKDRAAAVEEKNKLAAELSKLKEELTAAKKENEKATQAKAKVTEAEAQFNADKKKLEAEIALLSQEKSKAVQDQDKYVQEVLKLTEEKNKLSAELTKAQSPTQSTSGSTKDNTSALKKQIETLTQELEQSKDARKKLQDEVVSLKKTATDSPKRSNSNGSGRGNDNNNAEGPVVAALKKQLESEQKTTEALRKQINDLTTKRRGSSQASTIERAALEAKLSLLEDELAAKKKLDTELANAKKELEVLKTHAANNNNSDAAKVEAEITKQIEAKYKQHITGLEKKMKNYNQLRDDLNRMRKQYGDAEKQRRQFEQQVATLKKQVQSLQNKSKNANNNNSNGSAAVSNGNNTLSASSIEIADAEKARLKELLFTWMSLALKLNMMAAGKVVSMDKESVFQQIENRDPNTWSEVIMEQYNKQ